MNDPEEEKESPMTQSENRAVLRSEPQSVDTVDAHTLLGGARMLRIELEGELYTLRLTRNNRLILTK